jgi:hypothetical protein
VKRRGGRNKGRRGERRIDGGWVNRRERQKAYKQRGRDSGRLRGEIKGKRRRRDRKRETDRRGEILGRYNR